MKRTTLTYGISFSLLLFFSCRSGLVTTTNKCYDAIKAGEASNSAGNYSAALDQFNNVLKTCDAYDAKEKAYAGKATALNGLKQYNDALAAANEGLKISSTGVDNMFQKASAELGLGMQAEAKADFAKIIDMTAKNRNVKERATIYGKIAELDLRENMYSDAMNNAETAISLDSTNPDFYVLKGDVYAAQKDYTNALAAYDQAATVGGNTTKSWQAKIEAETKMYQNKYNTGTDAATLGKKMSASEKQVLCGDITKAQQIGLKNQTIDLLQLALCK